MPETKTEPTIKVMTKRCIVCSEPGHLVVPAAGYDAWERGELIQRALPELTNEQREQLISGTHSRCWSVLNPDEHEEWYE